MFTLLTGPGYDADGDLSWGAHWAEGPYEVIPDYDWRRDDWSNDDRGPARVWPIHLYEQIEQSPDYPW